MLTRRLVAAEAENIRLRAALIQRDSELAFAREDQRALASSVPGLPRRLALVRRVDVLSERLQSLLRERPAAASALRRPQQVQTGGDHRQAGSDPADAAPACHGLRSRRMVDGQQHGAGDAASRQILDGPAPVRMQGMRSPDAGGHRVFARQQQ